jgi:hypothetical protein
MNLVDYDKRTKTSTVQLTDVELVDLNELVIGILATYKRQDPTVIGVGRERLQEISEEFSRLLEARNAPQPAAR